MRRSACVVSLLCLLTAVVDATTVAPLSFQQLVNESAAVVYGRVVDVRAQWTGDRRFIESVGVDQVLRGMKERARTIAFTVPGDRSAAT